MDFVKKAMGKAEGQQGAQGTGAAAPAAPQAQGGQAQKDDYVDKGKPISSPSSSQFFLSSFSVGN
jgi:hypothetical protein